MMRLPISSTLGMGKERAAAPVGGDGKLNVRLGILASDKTEQKSYCVMPHSLKLGNDSEAWNIYHRLQIDTFVRRNPEMILSRNIWLKNAVAGELQMEESRVSKVPWRGRLEKGRNVSPEERGVMARSL